MRHPRFRVSSIVAVIAMGSALAAYAIDEYKSGIVWPEPQVVEPGATDDAPPSDAMVLFDGGDLSQFHGGEKWEVRDGYAVAREGSITSKEGFGDCQLHIEWSAPEKVESSGQGRGNSGVYLMGRYEVQILDSYQNETYFDGQAGSIYKQWPPLVNASRKPGEWQSYDILFEAPRFDKNGHVVRPGYVTVLHNGVAVQVHSELRGGTSYVEAPVYRPHGEKEPFSLQFHGNPVRFRNIWIREIKRPEPKYPA